MAKTTYCTKNFFKTEADLTAAIAKHGFSGWSYMVIWSEDGRCMALFSKDANEGRPWLGGKKWYAPAYKGFMAI